MTVGTEDDRGANLDFIAERISRLVKTVLADESEREVDEFRRSLEREINVNLDRDSSDSAKQLLTDLLSRMVSKRAAASLRAPLSGPGVDEALVDEHLAYDEQAAQAFQSTPRPDIDFDELLSSDQMAERLGVTRPTVHARLREGILIGWEKQSGRVVFPAGQLDGFNRPAAGLAGVVATFVDPQMAWLWLSRPADLLQGDIPVERLKSGRSSQKQIECVVDAARGQALGAFD
jgi:DNA-binding Lrp family transcriptional regulator